MRMTDWWWMARSKAWRSLATKYRQDFLDEWQTCELWVQVAEELKEENNLLKEKVARLEADLAVERNL